MKKSLIAVAAAGVLVSGAVAADTSVIRFDNGRIHAYTIQHDYNRPAVQHDRRWDGHRRDDVRQMNIDERQARIQERIERGFENGRLTRPEARRMQRQLAENEAQQRAFESDGRLGRREVAALHDNLDVLAQRLRNQLRDDDRRY
jgi:hypothetical protein